MAWLDEVKAQLLLPEPKALDPEIQAALASLERADVEAHPRDRLVRPLPTVHGPTEHSQQVPCQCSTAPVRHTRVMKVDKAGSWITLSELAAASVSRKIDAKQQHFQQGKASNCRRVCAH